MGYLEVTRQDLIQEKALIDTYSDLLAILPEGRLMYKKICGKIYYYYVLPGERKQKYISIKNTKLIQALKDRRYAEEALKLLRQNVKVQEQVLRKYKSCQPQDIFKRIGDVYQDIEPGAENIVVKKTSVRKPGEKKRMKYKSEERIHITTCGIMVRSKSEVIITELLHKNNVKFKYEEAIQLYDPSGNKKVRYPDFTIHTKNGQTIYWEHIGMMNKEAYREDFHRKLDLYYFNDILPGSNLIITADSKSGAIDVASILKIVENLS